MRRRDFLKMIGLSASALGASPLVGAGGAQAERLSFYAAGVRFHAPLGSLRSGDTVVLEEGRWNGQKCFRILTEQGVLIGHVPQRLVAVIESLGRREWVIASLRPHAVPWKRCCVALARSQDSRREPESLNTGMTPTRESSRYRHATPLLNDNKSKSFMP
jgi:hypothetical protein